MWIDDHVLANYRNGQHLEVFVPKAPIIVLGAGNDGAIEVDLEACKIHDVPVLRRYGGGGTVVLYSGCVVVSYGCWVKEQFQNSLYFQILNAAVIKSLATKWPALHEMSQAGISDIVYGHQKVAGTSLFRSRNYLIYQASLLVDLDLEMISGLLRHPSKEPDYRQGRSHRDFLTSLNSILGASISVSEVSNCLQETFQAIASNLMAEHLINPIESQMNALQARLDRATGKAL